MQDKVLEQLKKKYEYLDFDNAKVLECFYNAIEDLKSDNPSAFENENMFGLELEHYFLYYLVLEIQKGNQEIYDAVSIAMESTHDFFTRRRKDLANNFDIKKQKELYDQAFLNTINCYYKKMRFASLLLQNLIDVYKEEIEKSKNITKNKEVEHMAYNMSAKSLYEVFKDYNDKLSSVIFKAFSKKEERSYALLVKKYGINLDGENAVGHLTYPEVTRLQGIMSRLHTWFKYGEYLLEQKESLESIMKFFVNTSDEKMAHILADFQREKEAERNRAFSSKYEIMKKYNISEKTLEDAVCYIKNKDHRILYKYRYGIGLKIKPANEIRDMFGMKLDQYERTILMIQNQLPNLIKQAKEQENMLVDLNPQGVEKESSTPTIKENIKEKVKPVISSKVEVLSEEEIDKKIEEALKKSDERRSRVSSDKGVTQNLDVKKVDNNSKGATFKPKKRSKKYTYFCERCYPADIKEEEKQLIDEKIYAAFDLITSYEDGKEAAKKIYGEDLKQKAKDVPLNRLENAALGNLITKIKKMIFSKIKDDRVPKKEKNRKGRPMTFFEYFYKEGMTEEEKEEINKKVVEFVQKSKSAGVKVIYRLFGENLEQFDKMIQLDQKEKNRVNWLKFEIRKFLNNEAQSTNVNNSSRSKKELKFNFYEYFYKEDMAEEEKEKIKEKLQKALLLNKDTKAYQTFLKIYDEEFNLKEGIEVDRIDKIIISKFVSTLSRNLSSDLDYLLSMINEKKKRAYEHDTLFEYFYEEGMDEEREKEIDNKILEFMSKSKLSGVEIAKKLYGESLDHLDENIKLEKKENANLVWLRREIAKYLREPIQEINRNRTNRPMTFFEYFYEEGMNEERKKEINNKILEFISESKLSGVEIAKKLYGESLDHLDENIKLEPKENSNLCWLRHQIERILKDPIKNSTKEINKNRTNRPMTFFNYFYKEGMSEVEKEEIKQFILKQLKERENTQGYIGTKNIYGQDFATLQENYTQNDSNNCIQLRIAISKKLEKYFIEKNDFDKKMEIKDLNETYNEIENSLLHEDENLLDSKDGKISSKSEDFPDIAPLEEEIVEVEDIEEEIPVEEIAFDILRQQFSYKDSLILKLHNASFTESEIIKTLSITEEDLINCYINNLELTQNIDEVLDYILVHCPDRLKDVLESSYLSSFMEELTSKEQELVYLRLLSKTNPTLTVDVISLLIDISVEEIANYQIMSKDDVLNSLNNYINKPNYEVEKLKSKLVEK